MFSSETWLAKTGSSFYNGVATQSLRFNDGDSAHLTFTPSSASSSTDRRKITHSVWIKRATLGADQTIYSANKSGGGDYYLWRFSSDDKMTLILDVDDSNFGYDTSAVFRDTNWYHFVLIIDTTQSTDTDRVKLYANGVLQTISTKYSGGHVSQNFETYVMDGDEDEIGRFAFTDGSPFDGYMSEVITTIGQDNTISQFGEFKEGCWIPIKYSGSFGGNGFRLEFKQTGTGTASTSTIGADTSGNTNHWTSANLVASDSNIPDSPENNFATLGGLEKLQDFTLSEGNLKYTTSTNQRGLIASTAIPNTGKHYFECRVLSVGTGTSNADDVYIGVCEPDEMRSNLTGNRGGATVSGAGGYTYNFYNGYAVLDGTAQSADSIGYKRNFPQIIGVAVDRDNNNIKFTWDGSSYSSTYSIPADVPLYVYVGSGGGTSTAQGVFNFGQDSTFLGAISAGGNADGNSKGDFSLAVPSGYLALCTSNLPEPTIGPNSTTQASDHFDAVLYTSNNIGAGGTQNVTGVGFQPDLVWVKNRTNGSSAHCLFDSTRGTGRHVESDSTNAEIGPNSQYGYLSAFNSNGFTLTGGSTSANYVNQGTDNYVTWNWKANGGTTTTNDASSTGVGDIDSVYQADAGFSIVTYTGEGSNNTDIEIAHGLGVQPKVVIVKNRTDNTRWQVYHEDLSADGSYTKKNILLDTDGAESGYSSQIKAVSSTTFTVRDADANGNANVNKSSSNYVAYCFAEIEGYSRHGIYEGNGSTDGSYIYTGFTPRWIMTKRIDASDNWAIYDSARDTFNVRDSYLLADTTNAEATYSTAIVDFLSNGFKWRGAVNFGNNSSGTYIYMAFASLPFKYSNAI